MERESREFRELCRNCKVRRPTTFLDPVAGTNMSVETLQRPLTPTFDPGGRHEPDFNPNDTIVIAEPIGRILPTTEAQKPDYRPLELEPNLVINSELQKAGYDVRMEMGRLTRDTNTFLKEGKSLREAVSMAAGELEVNLKTYDLEIIKSRPVLPHLNRFGIKNGQLRMVGNNGEPVVDAISAKERNGSVLEASRAIENFLLSAENNSFAVLMNSAGWNGFIDKYGQEAEPHLNTEAMVFWKDQKSNLKGLTIVVDANEKQAREIMVGLGVPEELLRGETEQERLANIVRNPVLLSLPRSCANPFEYVLDKMLAERGEGDFGLRMRDGTVEIRSVEEVRADIKRFEELLLFLQEEERLITEPSQFILEEADRLGEKSIQQEVVNKIEKAILRLTRKHLSETGVYFKTIVPISSSVIPAEAGIDTNRRDDDFSMEMAFLKTRAGCPASVASRILGGVSLGQSMGGIVSFAFGGEAGKKGKTCISCGEVNYCTKACYKCNGMLV